MKKKQVDAVSGCMFLLALALMVGMAILVVNFYG